MVNSPTPRMEKHKKRLAAARGFVFARSRLRRSIRQQLLHAGQTARVALKLKKRVNKKSRTKLLNLFLRTKGIYYSQFKSRQKIKGIALNDRTMLDIVLNLYNECYIYKALGLRS